MEKHSCSLHLLVRRLSNIASIPTIGRAETTARTATDAVRIWNFMLNLQERKLSSRESKGRWWEGLFPSFLVLLILFFGWVKISIPNKVTADTSVPSPARSKVQPRLSGHAFEFLLKLWRIFNCLGRRPALEEIEWKFGFEDGIGWRSIAVANIQLFIWVRELIVKGKQSNFRAAKTS